VGTGARAPQQPLGVPEHGVINLDKRYDAKMYYSKYTVGEVTYEACKKNSKLI
jgi:hypothetical protein